jgi:hypothetical protein
LNLEESTPITGSSPRMRVATESAAHKMIA